MHIILDMKSSLAEGLTKGAITGYTWGLIGYTIEEKFTMDVDFTLNGQTINKSGYKQNIAYIAGMWQGKKVADMSEMKS